VLLPKFRTDEGFKENKSSFEPNCWMNNINCF